MIIEFRESFLRDIRKIKNRDVLHSIEQAISQVETAACIKDISQLKKMKHRGNYFRIRLGDYRCGLCLEGDVVVFVRCLHRRDIYRYFPNSQ